MSVSIKINNINWLYFKSCHVRRHKKQFYLNFINWDEKHELRKSQFPISPALGKKRRSYILMYESPRHLRPKLPLRRTSSDSFHSLTIGHCSFFSFWWYSNFLQWFIRDGMEMVKGSSYFYEFIAIKNESEPVCCQDGVNPGIEID